MRGMSCSKVVGSAAILGAAGMVFAAPTTGAKGTAGTAGPPPKTAAGSIPGATAGDAVMVGELAPTGEARGGVGTVGATGDATFPAAIRARNSASTCATNALSTPRFAFHSPETSLVFVPA